MPELKEIKRIWAQRQRVDDLLQKVAYVISVGSMATGVLVLIITQSLIVIPILFGGLFVFLIFAFVTRYVCRCPSCGRWGADGGRSEIEWGHPIDCRHCGIRLD